MSFITIFTLYFISQIILVIGARWTEWVEENIKRLHYNQTEIQTAINKSVIELMDTQYVQSVTEQNVNMNNASIVLDNDITLACEIDRLKTVMKTLLTVAMVRENELMHAYMQDYITNNEKTTTDRAMAHSAMSSKCSGMMSDLNGCGPQPRKPMECHINHSQLTHILNARAMNTLIK